MNLTRIIITACMCALVVTGFAGSPMSEQKKQYAKFEPLMKNDDYDAAEGMLRDWQAKSADDVELAVAWANLYVQKAQYMMNIYSGSEPDDRNIEPGKGTTFQLTQPGTTETVGFLDTRPRHDDRLLTQALTVLRDAATTHPQRTDIWMGAAHVQLLASDFDGAYNTLRDFAQYVRKNPQQLHTRYNEPLKEKAAEFMPKTLHSYALRGYESETTAGLEMLFKVARLSQSLYPEHPYAYNDEAIYHNLHEDDEKVLDCLMRAHKVRPRDALVTMNIAGTYKNMKQREKAREFYRLTIKIADDEELKEAARDELDRLKGGE